MDDALTVRFVQRVGDLQSTRQRFGGRKRPSPETFGERFAL